MANETLCPCNSAQPAALCCERFLLGANQAETAEQLMRSRYTAFCRSDFAYLKRTHHVSTAPEYDKATETEDRPQWTGLEIVHTEKGGQDDNEGWVDFIARFKVQGIEQAMREKSRFVKESGAWLYLDGKNLAVKYNKTTAPGRNDPCTCGSGKKYKKCCGA